MNAVEQPAKQLNACIETELGLTTNKKLPNSPAQFLTCSAALRSTRRLSTACCVRRLRSSATTRAATAWRGEKGKLRRVIGEIGVSWLGLARYEGNIG
jgi:hypothetical protein